MVELDLSVANSIYEGFGREIYFSFMDKKHLQKFTLSFGTACIIPDKNNNTKHNIAISGIATDVLTTTEKYTKGQYIFIAPQKTFWIAFKNIDIDARKFTLNNTIVQLEIRILTKWRYDIEKIRYE